MTGPTRTVFVVSFVYWNGDDQGGGGFWWYPELEPALEGFAKEKAEWCTFSSRVRLVRIADVPAELTVDEVTSWLDADINRLENTEPALRVAISCEVAA